MYQTQDTAYASLQTLSAEDIDAIAAQNGLDVAAFRHALARSRVQTLAEQPLTLEMLLKWSEVLRGRSFKNEPSLSDPSLTADAKMNGLIVSP